MRRSAATLPQIAQSPLIVLVDQFEEIYSLCQDLNERKAFIENLLHAASERNKQVSVIFTLRNDFLGQIQKQPQLNQALAKENFNPIVPAMSKDELERASARPAELAGHPLHKDTVQRLVGETEGREGALPLLQGLQ